MKVLLTGGTGYIGSHIAVELIESGNEVIILDNNSNSHREVLERIGEITGVEPRFYHGDIRDKDILRTVFEENDIESVIHLAGLKSVPESVEKPLVYYDNNVVGSTVLFEVMREYGVKNLIFSSSATVYGDTDVLPITEESKRRPATNPYGKTKVMIEEMLEDLYVSDPSWNIILLRYFNPIGAHESGLIGDDPVLPSTSLIPAIVAAASGEKDYFTIYGGDYDTKDGTGIRDYIHVVDLAKGHVKAIEKFSSSPDLYTYNLGTGEGYTVKEVLEVFEKVIGEEIPHQILGRRKGDIRASYCDVKKAKRELDWEAKKNLEQMCSDFWRWHINNPNGYKNGARDGT